MISAPCSRASHANYGLQTRKPAWVKGHKGIHCFFCFVLYLPSVLNSMSYDGARILEASGRPIGDPSNEEADELSKRASVFGHQSEGMITPACRLKYSVKTLCWSRKRATTYSQLGTNKGALQSYRCKCWSAEDPECRHCGKAADTGKHLV